MSICIIAEYNPFHNGHIFQLNQAKALFPNEKIIIIMSGEYVQRGEIAVASFKERKKIALKYGADEVIELPFKYATQAAHIFAKGAIEIVAKNNIDKIFFGSESNEQSEILNIAKEIYKNQEKYNKLLKFYLKQKGNSFPKASGLALKDLVGKAIIQPNDILALEYCKAIVFNKFKIKAYSLKRKINCHKNNLIASASYIRQLFYDGKNYSMYTPMKLDPNRDRIEYHYKNFQKIIITTPSHKLKKNKMISEGMENLFKKHINAKTMDQFVSLTNSKRYTSSRIKRTILYIIKNIKK